MDKTLLKLAGIFGLLAVVLGAFGAHGLKPLLSLEQMASFQVGIRYQFYHAIMLVLLAVLSERVKGNGLKNAGLFFAIGIVLFSGSIYLLSCKEILGIETWKWLGPITPLGGLCFIIGWALIIIQSFRKEH